MAERAKIEQALAGGAPTTIADVVERLQAVDAALPAGDGVSWFAKLYLEVTQSVGAAVVPGSFRDPAFLEQLDIAFAELFFEAMRRSLQAPPRTPKAWAPLLEARSHRRIAPIQFALAGMNAHINRDLPVAVVSTCRELGTTPGAGSHRSDYGRVDLVLAEVERSVRQSFEMGALLVADAAAPLVGDVVVNWKLLKARTAAWSNAEALWTLGQVSPQVAAEYLDTLDGLVGLAGRGLLAPVVPVLDAPDPGSGRLPGA